MIHELFTCTYNRSSGSDELIIQNGSIWTLDWDITTPLLFLKSIEINISSAHLWSIHLLLNPVESLNLAHGEVYSIQHYVIKFVCELRHVCGCLKVLLFPPPIKLTSAIWLKYCFLCVCLRMVMSIMLSYQMFIRSEFRVVMSATMFRSSLPPSQLYEG